MKNRKRLLAERPGQYPGKENEVVATSRILKVEKETYLEIDIWKDGELKARYFASPNEMDWDVFVDGGWRKLKLNSVAQLVKCGNIDKSIMWRQYIVWDSKEDELRADELLGSYSVSGWEDQVAWKKRNQAMQRKSERIAQEMMVVPKVPERMYQWLDEEIFPGNYLIKENGEYKCTACAGTMNGKWTHGKTVICPECGKELKVSTRWTEKKMTKPVVLLQVCTMMVGRKYVERQMVAHAKWRTDGKCIVMEEQLRALVPVGMNWGKLYYGEYKREPDEQEFWDKNTNNRHFLESLLYPYNLRDVLPEAGLEHTGILEMASAGEKFNVNAAIIFSEVRPWMEYIAKAGLTHLASDITNEYRYVDTPKSIDEKARKMKDLLRLDGNRYQRLKRLKGGDIVLKWLQYEQKSGKKIDTETLIYLEKVKVHPEACEEILAAAGSVNRMAHYMQKQTVPPRKMLVTWVDYIRMAREEGMNEHDDIVRFPKDLRARHDELVQIRTERNIQDRIRMQKEKYSKLDEQIQERIPDIRHLFYEDDMYMIVPAAACIELEEEGRALHHCVGASTRYMEKMAQGTSWICFVRKKEELQKPWYTIEIDLQSGEILQAYTEYDRKTGYEKIKKIIEKWGKRARKAA